MQRNTAINLATISLIGMSTILWYADGATVNALVKTWAIYIVVAGTAWASAWKEEGRKA